MSDIVVLFGTRVSESERERKGELNFAIFAFGIPKIQPAESRLFLGDSKPNAETEAVALGSVLFSERVGFLLLSFGPLIWFGEALVHVRSGIQTPKRRGVRGCFCDCCL